MGIRYGRAPSKIQPDVEDELALVEDRILAAELRVAELIRQIDELGAEGLPTYPVQVILRREQSVLAVLYTRRALLYRR